MTPAADLIARCRTRGIHLWVESGRLRYDAPQGALDPDLRAELLAHKVELVELLAPSPPAPVEPIQSAPSAGPGPLDALEGPRRTAWGTLAWSDPAEPALELFGPPPAVDPPPAPSPAPPRKAFT
jgi:hypothetical protein